MSAASWFTSAISPLKGVKLYLYGALAAALVVGVIWYRAHLIQIGYDKRNAEFLQAQNAWSAEVIKLQDDVRQAERDKQDELARVNQQYVEVATREQNTTSNITSRVRSGALRVRRDLTCNPAASKTDVPGAAAAAGRDHAAGQGGLSPETAAAVIGIGGECDQVALKLQRCQAYVRNQVLPLREQAKAPH